MPKIWVEIVLALQDKQHLLRCQVDEGMTVQQVLQHTDFMNTYSEFLNTPLEVGVFGTKVTEDYVLQNEDRIEIYRSLKVDPKQNRRIRSEKDRG